MDAPVIGWAAIVALFLVWEAIGLRNAHDGWPTFTDLVRRYIPRWMLAMALGWLAYHFLLETGQ